MAIIKFAIMPAMFGAALSASGITIVDNTAEFFVLLALFALQGILSDNLP